MADLTDEEYDALDEYYTKNTIMPIGKPGFFARQRLLLDCLDTVTAQYIQSRAKATKQTPAQVIGMMARRELSAAS
jgi:hypothetical protein